MCSVPNAHNIPLRVSGKRVGTISVDRTEETKGVTPYRVPMLRMQSGQILVGKETLVQGGQNGIQGG